MVVVCIIDSVKIYDWNDLVQDYCQILSPQHMVLPYKYEKRGVFKQATLSARQVRVSKKSRGIPAFVGLGTVSGHVP